MPEPIILAPTVPVTEPVVTTPVEPVATETVTTTPEPDLVTKVSQFKPVEATKPADYTFNINELDESINAIQDEGVRKQMLGLKKSLVSGQNRKYQEIADQRKQLEAQMTASKQWTPERIQELLKDQSFVSAAQQVQQEVDMQETSFLSEADRKAISDAKSLALDAKQELEQQKYLFSVQKQDEVNKAKYANYNPEAVDIITSEMLSGKGSSIMNNFRENIHKVIDYEPGLHRAYKMGLKDGRDGIQTNQQAASAEGVVVTSSTTPLKEQGESDMGFFKRLALNNISKLAKPQAAKP